MADRHRIGDYSPRDYDVWTGKTRFFPAAGRLVIWRQKLADFFADYDVRSAFAHFNGHSLAGAVFQQKIGGHDEEDTKNQK